MWSGVVSGVGGFFGCAKPGRGDPALFLTSIPMNQLTVLNPSNYTPAQAARKALTHTVEEAFQHPLLKNFAMVAAVNGLPLTEDFDEMEHAVMEGWVARVEFKADGFRLKVETPEDRSLRETGSDA